MGATRQSGVVEALCAPQAAQPKSIEDIRMAIRWPAAVGEPDGQAPFDRADPDHPKRRGPNAGLDVDRDGLITRAACAAHARRQLAPGGCAENATA